MNILVQLPEPLASQAAAAKSHATSLEQYVIKAVANTVAKEPSSSAGEEGDPVLGSFAADAEFLDSVVEHTMTRRRTAPARTAGE